MRITEKDMNEAVHTVKKSDKDYPLVSLAFTMFGQHDELTNEFGEYLDDNSKRFPLIHDVNSDKALARIDIGKSPRYFIKSDNRGEFYNPLASDSGRAHVKLRLVGNELKFREVNYNAFINYLSFLKTSNVAW